MSKPLLGDLASTIKNDFVQRPQLLPGTVFVYWHRKSKLRLITALKPITFPLLAKSVTSALTARVSLSGSSLRATPEPLSTQNPLPLCARYESVGLRTAMLILTTNGGP